MKFFILMTALLNAVLISEASLNGPFLFWGHSKVMQLQPRALVEADEKDFAELFKDTKKILIFLRNDTSTRLDGNKYPKFQQLVKDNIWAYLPQYTLRSDPFNYNANVEVINLNGIPNEEDDEILGIYNTACSVYGKGDVLGILANRNLEKNKVSLHVLSKREASRENNEEDETSTTPPPNAEETEESFIYVADGRKAILYVNNAPMLNITEKKNIKLVQHQKLIQFDDQRAKGYGRLSIKFLLDKTERVTLRFNFTLDRGTWSLKAVEVEYLNASSQYKNVLKLGGIAYSVPYAPIGFSYRCSARPLIFENGTDRLVLSDYQVQPWLEGSSKFGDVYDCVGFTSSAIWAGILVSLFLCGILSVGLMALMDIKTPNRFESSRSKQLTFTTQE